MVENLNQKQVQPCVIDSLNLPHDTWVKVTWLLGHCSRQMHKSCAEASTMYSWAECVFNLKHYFASKLFVKHLAMHILIRKYRIRQYTDW
jgi:hypothetical protein